jgi:hypothetical protein
LHYELHKRRLAMSLLGQKESLCDRLQEWLEKPQGSHSALETYETFLAAAPANLREHAESCSDCHDAAADIVAVRNLLREADAAPVAGPWFVPRVMAAVAAREAELSRGAAIWLAVPRFAARLSWVAAALLVFTCTWLYERPVPVPQTASAYATDHLFDPPAIPANHDDDVLLSLNEKDQ